MKIDLAALTIRQRPRSWRCKRGGFVAPWLLIFEMGLGMGLGLGHGIVPGLKLPGPAYASSLIQMDLPALSRTAERILIGTVEKVEPHFLSPSSHYIVTDVTLRSERNLLGVPEGTAFMVRHLGGEVGQLGQRVYGEASYRVGDRVLLFAAKRQGVYYSVGMAQGTLAVYQDGSGVLRVKTRLVGAELIGPKPAVPVDGRVLDEVVTEIKAYLSRRSPPAAATGRE